MLLGSDIRILVSIFAMPNIAKIYEKGIIATINTTEFYLCICYVTLHLPFFFQNSVWKLKSLDFYYLSQMKQG